MLYSSQVHRVRLSSLAYTHGTELTITSQIAGHGACNAKYAGAEPLPEAGPISYFAYLCFGLQGLQVVVSGAGRVAPVWRSESEYLLYVGLIAQIAAMTRLPPLEADKC